MIHKKIFQIYKKFPVWLKVVSGFIAMVIVLIIGIAAYIGLWFYKNDQAEKIIDKKFHAEASQMPQLKVNRFTLWEGDSIVDANIQNKGHALFWYGEDGVPRLNGIGNYSTTWDCFFVDTAGKKTEYAVTWDLYLGKDSPFKKWFPFEVNNVKDLVNKYDAIIKVLATFPKKPETIVLEPTDGRWGKRDVVKHPNPNYILKLKEQGKDIQCDLFE